MEHQSPVAFAMHIPADFSLAGHQPTISFNQFCSIEMSHRASFKYLCTSPSSLRCRSLSIPIQHSRLRRLVRAAIGASLRDRRNRHGCHVIAVVIRRSPPRSSSIHSSSQASLINARFNVLRPTNNLSRNSGTGSLVVSHPTCRNCPTDYSSTFNYPPLSDGHASRLLAFNFAHFFKPR
jgi:hypothetical protein